MRAITSAVPPGGNGTTMRVVLPAVCARALALGSARRTAARQAASLLRNIMRVPTLASPTIAPESHVRHLLPGTEIRWRTGHAARISHANGRHAGRPGLAPGGRLYYLA